MPRVSVIMPSYNKEKYIAEAIKSILNQTYADLELLIIDDASSDNSADIIHSFCDQRIVFSQNAVNLGIAATRNIGLDMARGEYIALLDADDISPDYRLEKQVQFLDANLDVDVVFGGTDEIDEYGIVKKLFTTTLQNPKYIKARLMVRDVISNGSCMYRKHFIDEHEIRYRDEYYGMDDYRFWVECSIYGKITSISETLLYWRNTPENSTKMYMLSEEYAEKRKAKYAEIHTYALIKNGFVLTEEELALYNRILSEGGYRIQCHQDIVDFWKILKKLCSQSEGMDNSLEIKKMYKKQFGLSLERSYIWD